MRSILSDIFFIGSALIYAALMAGIVYLLVVSPYIGVPMLILWFIFLFPVGGFCVKIANNISDKGRFR